jgi:hypothetical protein
MRAMTFAAAGVLAAISLAAPASATQIYVSYMSLANGYEFATFQPTGIGPAGPWSGGTEYTGQQDLTANYGDTSHAPYFNVFAWCVDVFHDINIGGNAIVYNLVPLTVPSASDIQKVAAWGDMQLASGPNALISAAVQAEIWNLEYNMELAPGSNPALVNEVAYINDTLLPELPPATGAMLAGFAGDGSIAQTLYTSAPEPASLTLFGTGLVAAALVRRKRRPDNPARAPLAASLRARCAQMPIASLSSAPHVAQLAG